jgi:ABC-2 type transport system ATP-binding protein
VLLTTNYLDEATALCDRVAILDRGRLVACERPGELRRDGGVTLMLQCGAAATDVAALLAQRPDVAHAAADDGTAVVRLPDDAACAAVIAAAHAAAPVTSVRVVEPSLEDVFLGLTGRELRE